MAVYAAHLTRTLQGTPSLFQVTAQEALGATVKPALRKLVEYLTAVYPNKCGWCVQWFDELYLLFDCCLQYYYLKHYAASFSESFYGLLRIPTTRQDFHFGRRLPVALEQGSLALLVLVPYFREKLEGLVERWRADDDDGLLGKSKSDRARRAAIHIYSTVHMATTALRLAQLARYLGGAASAHSPQLALLGLALRDAPPRDEEDGWGDWLDSLKRRDFGSLMVTFPMVGGLILRGVEYGAFLVQFLRWWETSGPRTARDLPAPPPPAKDEKCLRFKNICPICLQPWKIPTVLPVSGYVFCYVCINRHVREHGACPATRAPAAAAHLVRLYLGS